MELTNNIPICPYCKKGTRRTSFGSWTSTNTFAIYTTYDEEGNQIDTEYPIKTTIKYWCHNCNHTYTVIWEGNDIRYL